MAGKPRTDVEKELVSNFLEVTAGQDSEIATQFLQISNWNVEDALQKFFNRGDSALASHRASSVDAPAAVTAAAEAEEALSLQPDTTVAFVKEKTRQPSVWDSEQNSSSSSRGSPASLYCPRSSQMFDGPFDKMEHNYLKEMVLGKPAPLMSKFHLCYGTILKLKSHSSSHFPTDSVFANSFHMFQYEKASAEVDQKIKKLELEIEKIDAVIEHDICDLEKKILHEKIKPVTQHVKLGRLVKISNDSIDWGWGVVASEIKNAPRSRTMSPALVASLSTEYTVDALVCCDSSFKENAKEYPPQPGDKGKMTLVTFPSSSIRRTSSIVINVPSQLTWERKRKIHATLLNLQETYPEGLPEEHLINNLCSQNAEYVEWVQNLKDLLQKKRSHPKFKSESGQSEPLYLERAAFKHEIQQLKSKTYDAQRIRLQDELDKRLQVLQILGHIDAEGLVKLKGRATCLIDAGDELLLTEMLFKGTFKGLDHGQVALLVSCFISCASNMEVEVPSELYISLMQLKEIARYIAEVQKQCRVEIDMDEYVASSSRTHLIDVVNRWSKGATFEEVLRCTDLMAGDLVRHVRRLTGILKQMKDAADVMGSDDLVLKFDRACTTLSRSIINVESLHM